MAFGDRCDGKQIRTLSNYRRVYPFVMKTRTESAIYADFELEVGKTLEYMDKVNSGLSEKKVKFFHIFLASLVRTVAMRPQLNRFVMGRRLFQRNKIQISMIVKKKLDEESEYSNIKITFDPRDTLDVVIRRMAESLDYGRGDEKKHEEKEIDLLIKFPDIILRFIIWVWRGLDYYGILPASIVKDDPMYASVYVTNLGSLGLNSVFHHLFEYGNTSNFIALGKIHKAPLVDENGELTIKDVVRLGYTLDDRISEGIYFVRAIELFKNFMQNPEILENPPSEEDIKDYLDTTEDNNVRKKTMA